MLYKFHREIDWLWVCSNFVACPKIINLESASVHLVEFVSFCAEPRYDLIYVLYKDFSRFLITFIFGFQMNEYILG